MEMIIKAPPEGTNGGLEKSGMLPGGGGGSRRRTRASWASASLQVAFSTGQTLAVLDYILPAPSPAEERTPLCKQASKTPGAMPIVLVDIPCSATGSVHAQTRDQCMISFVISAWSAT